MTVPAPARGGAVSLAVIRVVLGRPPAEVGQAVIGRVTVLVTAFHSLRAGPHKGQEDEGMNVDGPLFSVPWLGANLKVAVAASRTGLQPLPLVTDNPPGRAVAPRHLLPEGPNRTVVANTVAGVSRDVPVLDGGLDWIKKRGVVRLLGHDL